VPTGPVLILSAGMGAGHDRVAHELAARLSASRVDCEVLDVLELLPLRLGRALRHSYAWTVRHAPALYAATYRVFFTSPGAPATAPLTALAAARLEELAARRAPAALVSTFHLGAQIAGRLRADGRLPVPSHVMITDFAVHRLWLHGGNDTYLCPTPAAARAVRAATGHPAWCHAPVVDPAFRRAGPAGPPVRDRPGGASALHCPVLVTAGSWGVGRVEETARVLAGSGRYRPVVLCGRNEPLRRRLAGVPGCGALGWRDDLPDLMVTGHALVDNAAGLTAREALAAGVPVVGHRPIPGHGRAGVRAMAEAGLSVYAPDAAALLAALDRLGDPGERRRQVERASAVFDLPSAETLLSALLT
jgi:UDP-N-acetylglucosamine:LPS N-acetylglucosamine transferase